jgi:hypothetical protein
MRTHAWAFVVDGAPANETPTAASALVERQERDIPPPEVDMSFTVAPRVYEAPALLRLRRDLVAGVGVDPSTGYPERVVEYPSGTIFEAASMPGAAAGEFFEAVDG